MLTGTLNNRNRLATLNLRNVNSSKVMREVAVINKAIWIIPTRDMSETNAPVYAGAMEVPRRL